MEDEKMKRENALEHLERIIRNHPYENRGVEALRAVNEDHQQFLSWGAKLRELMEHPAVQKYRDDENPRCVFSILKDALDEAGSKADS